MGVQAGAKFLTSPIDYTLVNLSPTSVAPVRNTAFGVGNILVAVFSSLYIVLGLYKGVGPLPHLSPAKRMLVRGGLVMLYSFGVACVFATICVGLAKTGSGDHLYSGSTWAQIMAIQWVHGMIWSFGNLALAIRVSPDVIGLPFALLLVSNVIGGFGNDFSDRDYRRFYQIFPFNWAIQLMRNATFDSFSSTYLVGRAVAVLICECLFFVFVFMYVSLREKSSVPPAAAERDTVELTEDKAASRYISFRIRTPTLLPYHSLSLSLPISLSLSLTRAHTHLHSLSLSLTHTRLHTLQLTCVYAHRKIYVR
jgi:hypothetical protein